MPEGAGEERRYSSYLFSTSALDGVCGQRQAPGKGTPVSTVGGWVGPRTGLDTEAIGKFFCLCWGLNLDRSVIQPVADTILTELPGLTFYCPSCGKIVILAACHQSFVCQN
jgi:hypothetical protein